MTHGRAAGAKFGRDESPLARRVAVVALLLLMVSAGGCRFLYDEFMWLDRAGPVTEDPRLAGDQDRP